MQILQVWDMFTYSCFFLFAVVHISIFFFPYIWNWAICETSEKPAKNIDQYLFISCEDMYLYGHSDRDWLFLLFSYSGLVNCMDKKCHEIVYMKLWPNMNSKLWKCTILTDFRVYRHIPTHLCYSWPHHPLKLTKKAWWCAKPACCANSDASMLHYESFEHIWTFISFVISRGLHRGSLPKSDKVAESIHTQMVLYFERSCGPNCRSSASTIVGSRGLFGWNVQGLSWLLTLVFLGLPLAVKTKRKDWFSLLRCVSHVTK